MKHVGREDRAIRAEQPLSVVLKADEPSSGTPGEEVTEPPRQQSTHLATFAQTNSHLRRRTASSVHASGTSSSVTCPAGSWNPPDCQQF
ncbi:hypothetical protein CesoFtcFv8_027155 [Champsocephalus esox]|uniref:Uncharacterized protein n=1 Tax=Champsocephalus esox TaxID=159716 RepID=A0AAN8G921_9TELE|nr:hypothetical protein CesoFtcFv8_027155 [Champsocephalus esox]